MTSLGNAPMHSAMVRLAPSKATRASLPALWLELGFPVGALVNALTAQSKGFVVAALSK